MGEGGERRGEAAQAEADEDRRRGVVAEAERRKHLVDQEPGVGRATGVVDVSSLGSAVGDEGAGGVREAPRAPLRLDEGQRPDALDVELAVEEEEEPPAHARLHPAGTLAVEDGRPDRGRFEVHEGRGKDGMGRRRRRPLVPPSRRSSGRAPAPGEEGAGPPRTTSARRGPHRHRAAQRETVRSDPDTVRRGQRGTSRMRRSQAASSWGAGPTSNPFGRASGTGEAGAALPRSRAVTSGYTSR